MSDDDCRSPIGLDCCSCCLDLANGCDESMANSPAQGLRGLPGSPTSPSVSHFRQLRNQLMYPNLNTDKLNNIMRQDSLESVVRDPCFLLNEGICNSNIDQTMLSILLFFHSCRIDSSNCLSGRHKTHPWQHKHKHINVNTLTVHTAYR
ncbi:TSC22 domain family protein 3 isoform X3 [Eleginops maclovinus]|uniref:TSC22 domain family protein 3 isoform X3 n=1 Tax=Eleginops maclovinus TaxID=56733 RepID=UPI0030803982